MWRCGRRAPLNLGFRSPLYLRRKQRRTAQPHQRNHEILTADRELADEVNTRTRTNSPTMPVGSLT